MSAARTDRLAPAEVAARLAERMRSLAVDLLGPPARKYGPDWRWRDNEALSVAVAGTDRGLWCDHADGSRGGDALDLIRMVRGGSLAGALRWALVWLGEPVGFFAAPLSPHRPPAPPDRRERACPPRTVELAEELWREAAPAVGTLAARYLASRGRELPPDAPIRFHPACPRGAERWPAMLALMTDPATGEPLGVHRTFLARDGSGKAPGQAKMMLGAAGVIRLVPDEEVTNSLGITEGIETALAVMQHFDWWPVWAVGSAGGIKGFPVLPGIEALTIFPDADDRGASLKAARECGGRWRTAGRVVELGTPPDGTDFCDLAGRGAA